MTRGTGKEGELRKSLKDLKPGRGIWFAFQKDLSQSCGGWMDGWKGADQVRGESRPGMRLDSGTAGDEGGVRGHLGADLDNWRGTNLFHGDDACSGRKGLGTGQGGELSLGDVGPEVWGGPQGDIPS